MNLFVRSLIIFFLFFSQFALSQTVVWNGADMVVDNAVFHVNNGNMTVSAYPNNSDLTLKNEATLFIEGDLFLEDTISLQSGLLHLGDDIFVSNTGFITNEDTIEITDDWNMLGNSYAGSGHVIFLGGDLDSQVIRNTSDYIIENVTFQGLQPKKIENYLQVKNVHFIDGLVRTTLFDTLLCVEGGVVSGASASSYVIGPFYNKGVGTLNYPVGDTSGFYPVRLLNVADPFPNPSPKIGFRSRTSAGFTYTPGKRLDQLATNAYWRAFYIDGKYISSQVEVSAPLADTAGIGTNDIKKVVVAQSSSLNGTYHSLGNSTSGVSGGNLRVTSAFSPADDFYALGSGCNGVKVAVKALLEGSLNPTMDGVVSKSGLFAVLENQFTAGGPGFDNMYPSYSIPNSPGDSAIDIVNVFLRQAASPFAKVDSTIGWLMTDGLVYDFETGTQPYVTFCNATEGNNYKVELKHRNHLGVMSGSDILASTAIPSSLDIIDFTLISTVYGGGGLKLINGENYIIAGNVTGNDKGLNAADWLKATFDAQNLINGYVTGDAELDGQVDVKDYDLTSDNSIELYYSTVP